MLKFDGENAANEYRNANLNNSDFRRELIEESLSCNDLETALNLCLEGEIVDTESHWLVRNWQEIRYNIHERMSEHSAQKELAYQFILNGDFDYFIKFKSLHNPDEWSDVLDGLIAVLSGNKTNIYVKILIAEDLKSLLMDYCKLNPRSLVELYPHLLSDYKNELKPLFEALIHKSATVASSRSAYQTVCGIIKHYKKFCGKSATLAVIDELLETYKKRPAFVDELRKISS